MNKQENETTAVEDLMKEHGILNRLLLIYEEFIRRIKNNINFDIRLLHSSACIIKKFIEDYHEQTEEKYVFPLVRDRNPELIDELIKQHRMSGRITQGLLRLSKEANPNLEKIGSLLHIFVHMYRFHETREDTEVFTWFKEKLSKEEYEKMSELFEKEEDEILGEGGYTKTLDYVKIIEKKLDIYDISIITKKSNLEIDEKSLLQ